MLQSLGTVAARRGRRRDAVRLLGQSLEIATEQRDARTRGRVQLSLARVRREEGDAVGAANAYRRALDGLAEAEASEALRARTMVELGEALFDVGDTEEASQQLEQATRLASTVEAWSISSAALGALGSLAEVGGERERAAERYQEAAQMAADAGDADAHARWRRAAASLGS